MNMIKDVIKKTLRNINMYGKGKVVAEIPPKIERK